jgi:hypothetical protein
MERLSNCQQPRELTLYPPTSIPLSTGVVKHLTSSSSSVAADWDYDRLLTKWKGVVIGSRRPTISTEVQSLPTPVEGVAAAEFSTPDYSSVNGFTPANAASPAPNGGTTSYSTADAPGEDAPADEPPSALLAKTHQRRPQPQQQARQMPQAVMVADAKARTAAAANPQAKSSTHGKGQTQRSDEGPMDVDVRSESMIAGKPDEARKAEATAAR